MGKYFLGSVGKAEAFRRNESGELELAFVSKTLTDSGLNISTTKDDVRAGEGAPVQFSFYHDSNVEITLTDVLWKKEYLEAQLGARFESGVDKEDYITEDVIGGTGTLTLTNDVKDMPIPCDGSNKIVWFTEQGQDNWRSSIDIEEKVVSSKSIKSGVKYCVRYLSTDSRAKIAEITSSIIPEELFLIITAPIFAGDACSASRGKAAGHITFEVPRFQLNGSQEFAMNMSQNQTMSLAGVALASESVDCETNAGKLLRIIEVINDEDWYDDLTDLVLDKETEVADEAPIIYGIRKNGSLTKLPLNVLVYKTQKGDEPLSEDWVQATDGFKFAADASKATTYHLNIYGGVEEDGKIKAALEKDELAVIPASE